MFFHAAITGNDVKIDWATATESDNDYFEVQRSSNGIEFESIATIPGQGFSVTTTLYQELDTDPLSGLSYYRLKQVDIDGTEQFSHVVPIRFEADGIHGWVNEDILYVSHGMSGTPYSIFDASGKLIMSGTLGIEVASFDISTLPRGAYLFRAENEKKHDFLRFMR